MNITAVLRLFIILVNYTLINLPQIIFQKMAATSWHRNQPSDFPLRVVSPL